MQIREFDYDFIQKEIEKLINENIQEVKRYQECQKKAYNEREQQRFQDATDKHRKILEVINCIKTALRDSMIKTEEEIAHDKFQEDFFKNKTYNNINNYVGY